MTSCGATTRGCGASRTTPDAGPTASSLRLVGRFVPSASSGGVRSAWSGSAFEVRFTGSALSMRLRVSPEIEKPTPYSVRVDDRPVTTFDVSPGTERYELAAGLAPGVPHEIRVVREAEAFGGVHELLGVDLGPGGAFLPPRPRKLHVEVVGDSITCGYGVLGTGARCGFSFATERASAAYGARLGQALDADVTTVCWSGRGVLRNYDGSTTGTMPELYELALPVDPPVPWSFAAAPRADAVIVNLGTNDFLGGAGRPLDLEAFEEAYVRFLRRVRDREPNAFVLVTTSPMLKAEPSPSGPGTVQELARTRLEHVVARRTSEGDARIELVRLEDDGPATLRGCDSHPDVDDNARIAARLERLLRARLAR